MPRRTTEFQTIRSEGGLLPPDLLRRVVDPAGKVSGVEPTAYGLPAGERINEAITQSWNRLRRHWTEFRAAAKGQPEGEAVTGLTNDKWSLPLLRELGFGFLATTAGPTIDGKTYAISRFAGNTAIHLVGCGVSLDRRAAGVRGAAQSNPHGLVQEFLNRSTAHLWAIVSNGLSFRILRDNQALSRQSFLEFDLEAMFDGEVYSDFVLLWLIAHATRFLPRTDGRPDSCWLETWSKEAAEQGVAALTDLRGGVEKALEILGQGFVSHPKNSALRDALRRGDVKLSAFHGQLLRIVYRLIFLFVAEDRELEGISLLHPQDKSDAARLARERYAAHYSTSRLRELASRIKGSRHGDLWRQFQLLVGALSGEDRFAAMRAALALPPLGSMLWNPASTALLNGPGLSDPGTELSNVDFLEALRHLAFIRKDKILRPVDYKNLGSEEFGGVYESFLALTPQISSDGARFTFAEFAGNERKTSGSYYTPDSLVQCLLDSALDPVVNERLADAERLAKADWAAVEKEIQSDPAKRTYVLAFLTKHAGASKTATAEERKRAWDSVPPAPRRWKLSEEAILAIKVCDKACGSGHFLVGAGHRLARHLARVRALAQGESEPSPLLYQTALRDVIGHCLYGVDINPMAVELCKVTLWLEAMEPGKPLSFLDHHIRCGNSLLGATPELIKGGIPDEAYEAIEGDDKEACAALKRQNKRENPKLGDWFIADEAAIRDKLFQAAAAIDDMGDSQPEDIHRKEAAFRNAQQNYDFQKAWDLANLWCAAFVIKKRFADGANVPANLAPSTLNDQPLAKQGGLFGGTEELPKVKGKKAKTPSRADSETPIGITTQHLRDFVEGGELPDGLLAAAKRLADQYQFFHFHLAFPEVFAQGGFDVSLGNPPWERVKLQEKEWFAERRPDIAQAPNAGARKRLIKTLLQQDPGLNAEFLAALRVAEGESHIMRHGGLYPLCGCGDVNLYTVFAERMRSLLNATGRTGSVLPSGIATDDTTKFFFQDVVDKKSLVSLFDFENRLGLFPDVDSRMKFCLFSTGSGAKATCDSAQFVFFAQKVEDLRDPGRGFSLSAEDIALLNPSTKTCPIFRSGSDAELTKAMYRATKPLARCEPRINFFPKIDMSDEVDEFLKTQELPEGPPLTTPFSHAGRSFVQLYESKLVWHFDHRFGTFEGCSRAENEAGQNRNLNDAEKSDANRLCVPRYYAPVELVDGRYDQAHKRHTQLLTVRRLTNATNERTAVFTLVPYAGCGNSMFVFDVPSTKHAIWLLASGNSLAFDYITRNKLGGTNFLQFIIEQLAVVEFDRLNQEHFGVRGSLLEKWIVPRVLELTCTAWDMEAFAQDCGWSGPPFRWDEERRFLLRCELDAAFFHLYLGSEEEWRKQPTTLTQAFPTPRDAVSYIMDTFPIVKRKDEARTEQKNAAGEVAKPGRYITKDTILEIYDALAESMKSGTPYQTRLNPAPADISCRHPKKKIGILAFGSLIGDPGIEIAPKIIMRIKTQTPFGVEYGRYSGTRGGAPTLVPHPTGGPVSGEILVLDDAVTVAEARDMLWRRERRKEGTGETYLEGTTANSVLVREWADSPCVERVLYTDFHLEGKVAKPEPAELAKRAIESVKTAKEGMDGITYLKSNLASGVKTKLTVDYEAEILKQTKANSLEEALRKARTA